MITLEALIVDALCYDGQFTADYREALHWSHLSRICCVGHSKRYTTTFTGAICLTCVSTALALDAQGTNRVTLHTILHPANDTALLPFTGII